MKGGVAGILCLLVHLTPTYGSWLNLVERWFAELNSVEVSAAAARS